MFEFLPFLYVNEREKSVPSYFQSQNDLLTLSFLLISLSDFWPGNTYPPRKEWEFKYLKFSVQPYYCKESLT